MKLALYLLLAFGGWFLIILTATALPLLSFTGLSVGVIMVFFAGVLAGSDR